jgi:hypothetical protein
LNKNQPAVVFLCSEQGALSKRYASGENMKQVLAVFLALTLFSCANPVLVDTGSHEFNTPPVTTAERLFDLAKTCWGTGFFGKSVSMEPYPNEAFIIRVGFTVREPYVEPYDVEIFTMLVSPGREKGTSIVSFEEAGRSYTKKAENWVTGNDSCR